MPVGAIIGIIAGAVVLLIILANLKIVPQAAEYVIEFLGKYKATWTAGVHVKVPFFERIAKRVTLKESRYSIRRRSPLSQRITLQCR